jgi:hypothetical protein
MKKLLLVFAAGLVLVACTREPEPAPATEIDPAVAAMIPPGLILEYQEVEAGPSGPIVYSNLHAHAGYQQPE